MQLTSARLSGACRMMSRQACTVPSTKAPMHLAFRPPGSALTLRCQLEDSF